MDDVQAFWYEEVVRNLTMTHYLLQIPLCIDVIPNRPGYGNFTSDVDQVRYLRGLLRLGNGLFEIAQHGWNHTNYRGKGEFKGRPYMEQLRDMLKGRAVLEEAFKGLIDGVTTFIPPHNLWDPNTTRAVAELGYRVFSSEAALEGPLHNEFDQHGVLFLGWSVYIKGPHGVKGPEELLAETMHYLNKYGVCVIVYHPQDFAWAPGSNGVNSTSYGSFLKFLKLLKLLSCELDLRFSTFTSYLKWREYRNLIPNYSFEKGALLPEGWYFSKGKGNASGFWSEVAHCLGNRSVGIMHFTPEDDGCWRTYVKVRGGTEYYFSAYLKSEDNGSGLAGIWVDYFDQNGLYLSGESIAWLKGPRGWTLLSNVLRPPPRANLAAIYCCYKGGLGRVWFDDVRMIPLRPTISPSSAQPALKPPLP